MLTLTYTVQVCNESRELYSLINFLLKVKDPEDDIQVVVDSLHSTEKVELVLKHFEEGYYIQHVTFSDYNNNHINPNLPSHKDPHYPEKGLTFDYQLESNVDWPFCIENDCFTMKDNEAIIFDPRTSIHNRPDQTFKDGEYVRIVFFYLNKN